MGTHAAALGLQASCSSSNNSIPFVEHLPLSYFEHSPSPQCWEADDGVIPILQMRKLSPREIK